jgi:hypothetical protein
LNIAKYDDFILNLDVELPPYEEFIKIADMTALHESEKNQFIQLNYERGPLLYGLISKFKPTNILEIGTARGYSTLCMAWAMSDNNIPGKIFTIDPKSTKLDSRNLLDDHSSLGARYENISVREIWKEISGKNWLDKIIVLNGYSGEIMSKNNHPKFDFGYIDGAHFYDAVKHDFYAFLKSSNSNFGILLDDYIDRKYYGVKKLVDEEISKTFDTTIIETDRQGHLLKKDYLNDPLYGMCWIQNSTSKKHSEFLEKYPIDDAIQKYRKYEQRIQRREKINKKLPFLKNIKLSFWKT